TIKHKKAATDAKRGKIFSKIGREIMVAARTGGGDPSANITLRALMQKAKSVNMPSDNVERAIKKGTGEAGGAALEEITYEGFAPGGVALVLQVLTDNRNRAAAEIRHIFTRHGANLSAQGSVTRNFHRKGQILVAADKTSEDKLLELVLDAGAEDMTREDDQFEILTDPAQFMDVVDALNKAGIAMETSEITFLPEAYVPVTDKAQAASLLKFIEALEDLDDVQNVYSNFDIADDLMKSLEQV
ncbi:MAG: YebC/PmpR family DNA-binding transcriptional regulator, partial [Kiritimatiellae bacterium]|nr:YebC/PmpR family DNA-binding transcriptional regulator [Kiritimatiellia bacterium]